MIRILLLPVLILVSSPSFAESKHATREEAQAIATKAADFPKKEGSDKAFAAFHAGGEWRDGDLYVVVFDNTGTWRASGAQSKQRGSNTLSPFPKC